MPAFLLARPWLLKLIGFGVVALAIVLFILGQRRAGANAAKAAIKMETMTRALENAKARRQVEEDRIERDRLARAAGDHRSSGERLHAEWGRD